MSLLTWLIILSIIFVSGIVKGTTGFGFALFSLPLLVHFIPIKTLVPVITLFNLFSSIQIVLQSRQLKITKFILLLSASGIVGVVIGTLILKFLPEVWLKLMAAISLIVLSVFFLTGFRFNIRKIRRGSLLAGLTSGLLGGSISVSGPPLALFLTSLKLNTRKFRFTFAWFSIITASIAMLDYIKIGVVHPLTFRIFIISLPVLFLSLMVGKRISTRISLDLFYKGSIVITLLAGILLFFSCINEYLNL